MSLVSSNHYLTHFGWILLSELNEVSLLYSQTVFLPCRETIEGAFTETYLRLDDKYQHSCRSIIDSHCFVQLYLELVLWDGVMLRELCSKIKQNTNCAVLKCLLRLTGKTVHVSLSIAKDSVKDVRTWNSINESDELHSRKEEKS